MRPRFPLAAVMTAVQVLVLSMRATATQQRMTVVRNRRSPSTPVIPDPVPAVQALVQATLVPVLVIRVPVPVTLVPVLETLAPAQVTLVPVPAPLVPVLAILVQVPAPLALAQATLVLAPATLAPVLVLLQLQRLAAALPTRTCERSTASPMTSSRSANTST